MNKPDISIIVTTHERESLLLECIISIQKQTYKTYELIIVNDGTNLSKKSRSFLDKINAIYIKTPHIGAAAARNKGVQHATGEYIAFCDDDDAFEKNKLINQITFLKKNPTVVLSYTNAFLDIKNRKVKFWNKINRKSFKDLLIKNNQILLSTVMMKRATFIELGGFDESLKYCEDYDLWLRISISNKISYIDKPLSVIKRHSSNSTLNKEKEVSSFALDVIKKNIIRARRILNNAERTSLFFLYYYQKGKYYYFEGTYNKARSLLFKSILYQPSNPKSYFYFFSTFINVDVFVKIRTIFYKIVLTKNYQYTR